jgi:hypothetical protein
MARDLTQVYDAMRKYNAAGDTASVKKLADYLKALPPEEPSPKTEEPSPKVEDPADNQHSSEEADPSLWEKTKAVAGVGRQMLASAVGGVAGLAAEGGAALYNSVRDDASAGSQVERAKQGKSDEPRIDPIALKEKVQGAFDIPGKAPLTKQYLRDIAESGYNPAKYLNDTNEWLQSTVDSPDAKAGMDMGFQAATAILPQALKLPGKGVKYAMRGNEAARVKMSENLAAFKRAGVDQPTVGQVVEGGLPKSSQASLATVERQTPQLEATATKLADKIDQAKSAEEAGKAITNAIEGAPETETLKVRGKKIESPTGKRSGGWVDDAQTREGELHQKWQDAVGLDTNIWLPKTFETLKKLTSVTAGAEETTAAGVNSRLMDIYGRLHGDAGKSRSIPLKAVEEVRQMIGEMTDPFMDARISSRDANALYAALKEDTGAAVLRKGPAVKKAYNDAFEYSRRMHEISDAVIEPLRQAKVPERVFAAATSGTSEGASTLRTLLNGDKETGIPRLHPAAMDAVRAVTLRKLGGSEKGAFSAHEFLTNWARMHKDAKDVLFGAEGSNLRNSLDALATVSDKLKNSKSAMSARREFGAEHGASHVAAETLGLGARLMDSQALSFATGRMISNPKFVKWLARASQQPKLSLKTALASLTQQTLMDDQQMQDDVAAYSQALSGEQK